MKSSLISNISFTLLVLTILVLPLVLAQESQLTDEEKKLIENKKWGEIAKLTFDQKNEILANINSNEKSEMLAGIAKNNLVVRISTRINKEEGTFIDKLKKITTETQKIYSIEFKGFDNSQLKFKEGNIITDGKTSIGLENLPEKLKKLEYSEGSFSLTFEDGSEIKYSNGIIDKDLRYISEDIPSSKTDKGKISLIPNKGKITIDNNGKFIIEKEAQVKVGGRTFEKLKGLKIEFFLKKMSYKYLDKESSFSIDKEGGQFKGKNLKIKTNAAEISIGDIETDIMFNKKKTSSGQYIRILGSSKISTDEKYLKEVIIKGEDVMVNLLNKNILSKEVKVSVDGKNIFIINVNDVLFINGEKTYSKTQLSEAIVDSAGMSVENKKSPNTNINSNSESEFGGSETIASKKDSKKNKKKYVTITKLNKVLTNPASVFTGGDPEMDVRETSKPIKPDFFRVPQEVLLFEDIIKMDNEQLTNFFESAKSQGINSEKKLTESFVKYANKNMESLTTFKYDIPKKKVDETLTTYFEDLNIPESNKQTLYAFKREFLASQKGDVPSGTQMILISNTNNGEPIMGVIKIIQNGKARIVKLPGKYVSKILSTTIKENQLSRNQLFNKYKTHKSK